MLPRVLLHENQFFVAFFNLQICKPGHTRYSNHAFFMVGVRGVILIMIVDKMRTVPLEAISALVKSLVQMLHGRPADLKYGTGKAAKDAYKVL